MLVDPGKQRYGQFTYGLAVVGFTVLLMAPNVISGLFGLADPGNYAWQKLAYAAALWIFWLALIGNIRYACLLVSPFLPLIPAESYLLVRYQSPLEPHILGILRETNFVEAFEYMRGLWGLALLALGGTALCAYVCLEGLRRAELRWRHRSRYWVLASLLVLGGGFHLLYEYQEAQYDLEARPDEFRVAPPPFLVDRLRETSPFGIPLRIYAYLESEKNLARVQESLKDFRFGAYQAPGAAIPSAFVLVLGESARADRWAINGYARPTSPKLGAQPNLLSFADMVSVFSATRRSIPVMLTRKPAQMDFGLVFRERSLVSAFREAGFRTHWFSTQAPTGYHDSPIALYAREADAVKFLNFSSYMYRTPFDGVLLPDLQRALGEESPRQLIVLHTLGSHFNYSHRYPPEFEVFRSSAGGSVAGSLHDPASRERLNDAYDNSILYTDHFLSEVIRILDKSGRPVTAMLYVADHGEQLFDDGCSAAGHSFGTRQNFHVASFFWHSDGYARAYPDKIAHLLENKDRKLTTESIFSTLLDAADIRLPDNDLSRSLLSSQFKERRRLVHGNVNAVDYDRARTKSNCQIVD